MLMRSSQRGFSLIELMVTLTVAGIVMAAVVPAAQDLIANSRVRSSADAVQNAIRLTQAEAIKRSRPAAFILTNAAPAVDASPVADGNHWVARLLRRTVDTDDTGLYLKGGTDPASLGVTVTGPAAICFNAFGQQVTMTSTANNLGVACTAPTDATPTAITFAGTAATKTMRVQVSLGGRVRMCDTSKTVSATSPDGC
jgi:type IV fimbrial biogenesis protein FimT